MPIKFNKDALLKNADVQENGPSIGAFLHPITDPIVDTADKYLGTHLRAALDEHARATMADSAAPQKQGNMTVAPVGNEEKAQYGIDQAMGLHDPLSAALLKHVPWVDTVRQIAGKLAAGLPTSAAQTRGFSTGVLESQSPLTIAQAALPESKIVNGVAIGAGAAGAMDSSKPTSQRWLDAGQAALGALHFMRGASAAGGGSNAAGAAEEAAAAAKPVNTIEGLRVAVQKARPRVINPDLVTLDADRAALPADKNMPPLKGALLPSEHDAVLKSVQAAPEGPLAKMIGWEPQEASIVDVEKAHGQANDMRAKGEIQASKAQEAAAKERQTAAKAQEQSNQLRAKGEVDAQKTQQNYYTEVAKAQDQANRLRSAEEVAEAKAQQGVNDANTKAADQAQGGMIKDKVDEARAHQISNTMLGKEAAAQAELQRQEDAAAAIEAAKEGLNPSTTVSETTTAPTELGKQSMTTRYTPPPPDEEGGDGGGGEAPPPKLIPINDILDEQGRVSYSSGSLEKAKGLAIKHGARMVSKKPGGYQLHYPEVPTPSEPSTPVVPAVAPETAIPNAEIPPPVGPEPPPTPPPTKKAPKPRPSKVQKFNSAVAANVAQAEGLPTQPPPVAPENVGANVAQAQAEAPKAVKAASKAEGEAKAAEATAAATGAPQAPIAPPPPVPEVSDTRAEELLRKLGGRGPAEPPVPPAAAPPPAPEVVSKPTDTPPVEAPAPTPAPKKDLMEEFLASQRSGPVPAGEPFIGENGEVIGHTTDTNGSTGFKPVDEAPPAAEPTPVPPVEQPKEPKVVASGLRIYKTPLDAAAEGYKDAKAAAPIDKNPLGLRQAGTAVSQEAQRMGLPTKQPTNSDTLDKFLKSRIEPELSGAEAEPSSAHPPRPEEPTTTPNTDTRDQTAAARAKNLERNPKGQPKGQADVNAANEADLEALSKMTPEQRKAWLKSQGGAVNTKALMDLGVRALGSTLGGAGGSYVHDKFDPKGDRRLPVAAGAILGLLSPELLKLIPTMSEQSFEKNGAIDQFLTTLNKVHNTGLLNPLSVAKKGLGDLGALRYAAQYNPDKAGAIMREMMNVPQLLNDFKTGYGGNVNHTSGMENLQGLFPNKGLGKLANTMSEASGRTMGGLTASTKGILNRAGFSPEEAAKLTFTNTPDTFIGKQLYKVFTGDSRGAKIVQNVAPFARIGINRAERGFENSPAGLLSAMTASSKAARAEAALKATVGSLTMMGAYEMTPEDFIKKHPVEASLLTAAMGPEGIPIAFAMAAKGAKHKPLSAGMKEATRDIPGFRLMEDIQSPEAWARNYLSGYTNITRPIAEGFADARGEAEPDTTSARLNPLQAEVNQTLANVPGVRETLPTRRGRRRR